MARKVFLRWLLAVVFIGNGIVTAVLMDFHHEIFGTTVGMIISSAILAIFVVTSLKLGIDSFALSSIKGASAESTIQKVKNNVSIGQFFASVSMGLGMVGTILGIIMVLKGFQGIEPGDTDAISALLKTVSLGFGAALYTTFVGLVCSIMLNAQCFNILFEIRAITEKDHG